MSPRIQDLRATLDDVAYGYEAPDPHTVLAGAHARSGELRRRRRARGWVAAAAAVVAVGGASLLLTDPGGDSQGEVAPAEPDESHTEGYGILDGVPQPYADGLTLVETLDEIDPDGGAEILGFQTDADTQMYAQAWCASGAGGVEIEVGGTRLTAPCADRASDTPHLTIPVPLPRGAEGFSVEGDPSAGTALVAVYEETEWADYPFPATGSTPFPPAQGVVINGSTPESVDPALDALPTDTRVHSVQVPISDAMTTFTMELNQPGQLMVAIDGVVLANDGETLNGTQQPASEPWRVANPAVREGYLHSFGPPVERSVDLNAEILAEEGIDVSDGEVTVSAYARGFVDDSSWRVVIGSDSAGGRAAGSEPLLPMSEPDFAEYAFGQRLVAAYDVPTDGVAHPIGLGSKSGTELTWVPQCPEEALASGQELGPDIGSVTVAGATESLRCLVSEGWLTALSPSAFGSGASGRSGDELPTVALRPVEGLESRAVAAYEPVPFEDFPFADSEPLFDDPTPQDGEVFGGGLVFGVTDVVTPADLDAEGTTTIQIPESEATQLYVTTEGKGRFWLESADPAEGAITGAGSPSSPENNFSATLGREDWLTSWTDQRTTWAITARTDSGIDPERVRLRVEGYQDGSFELRVIGQFPTDEQP